MRSSEQMIIFVIVPVVSYQMAQSSALMYGIMYFLGGVLYCACAHTLMCPYSQALVPILSCVQTLMCIDSHAFRLMCIDSHVPRLSCVQTPMYTCQKRVHCLLSV